LGQLPSGNLLHSYWTWPIEIVDLPIDGDFPVRKLLVSQRVYPWISQYPIIIIKHHYPIIIP
jgi:hypothetical protein